MNAFFGLLHNGCSELEIFMVDVIVFVIAAIAIYALAFLIRYNILKFVWYAKGGGPRYLKRRCIVKGKKKRK